LSLVATVTSAFLAFNVPPAQAVADGPIASLLTFVVRVATSPQLAWVVFAAILTAVPAMLSMRLTQGARRS
jgi:hypothetical protein